MEEELVQQHQCVERVVALKYDKEEKLRYLIKWKGLPYVECTWELTEDVLKAGGEAAIQDYKVASPIPVLALLFPGTISRCCGIGADFLESLPVG